MGAEAGEGGAISGKGKRASNVRGLDINQGPGAAAVQVTNNYVGLLRQGRAMLKHPLTHSRVAAGTLRLRDDARVAEGSGEDGGEGVARGVMDGGVGRRMP